jgi:hypothetical protein
MENKKEKATPGQDTEKIKFDSEKNAMERGEKFARWLHENKIGRYIFIGVSDEGPGPVIVILRGSMKDMMVMDKIIHESIVEKYIAPAVAATLKDTLEGKGLKCAACPPETKSKCDLMNSESCGNA